MTVVFDPFDWWNDSCPHTGWHRICRHNLIEVLLTGHWSQQLSHTIIVYMSTNYNMYFHLHHFNKEIMIHIAFTSFGIRKYIVFKTYLHFPVGTIVMGGRVTCSHKSQLQSQDSVSLAKYMKYHLGYKMTSVANTDMNCYWSAGPRSTNGSSGQSAGLNQYYKTSDNPSKSEFRHHICLPPEVIVHFLVYYWFSKETYLYNCLY